MNRTMFTQLTADPNKPDVASGVLVTQIGEGELSDNQFWVSREEAPDVIRMIADAFDMEVEVHEP